MVVHACDPMSLKQEGLEFEFRLGYRRDTVSQVAVVVTVVLIIFTVLCHISFFLNCLKLYGTNKSLG